MKKLIEMVTTIQASQIKGEFEFKDLKIQLTLSVKTLMNT